MVMNYNPSLQKKVFDTGWSAKELEFFWKKHGVRRRWGTVLKDLREGIRVFPLIKISKHILVAEKTAKEYVRYMLNNVIKNHGKSNNEIEHMVEDINQKTKKELAEKMMEEINGNDPFKDDHVMVSRTQLRKNTNRAEI